MAAPKRNPVEIETDRFFLIELYRTAGSRGLTVPQATIVLNERRKDAARRSAQLRGDSPEEVVIAGEDAKLSRQSVQRDLGIVIGRLRDKAEGSAALFLDGQIEHCLLDIEATYERDYQIANDLEASRRRSVVITSDGKTTTHQETRGADASLYSALGRCMDNRMRLRAEMRAIRFGKQFLPDGDREVETLTAQIAAVKDPEEARKLTVAMLTRELDQVCHADAMGVGVGGPDVARMHQARLATTRNRVDLLRTVIDLQKSETGGSGGKYLFEVEVVKPGNPDAPEVEA